MTLASDITRLDALRSEVAELERRVATMTVAQLLVAVHEAHPRARYVELTEGSGSLCAHAAFPEQTAVLGLVEDPDSQCGWDAYVEWTGGLDVGLSSFVMPGVVFEQLPEPCPLTADFDEYLFDAAKACQYLTRQSTLA